MITLEIIFSGLVALHNAGSFGSSFMVDGVEACCKLKLGKCKKEEIEECKKYKHIARLYVLDGRCAKGHESQCVDFDSIQKIDIEGYELSIEETSAQRWAPDNTPRSRYPVWQYPISRQKSRGFDWLTSMWEASGKRRALRRSCFKKPKSWGRKGCPLATRFDLSHGQVRSCHFYHCDERQSEKCEEKSKQFMPAYHFRRSGSNQPRDLRQALVDAVLVKIPIEGKYVTLRRSRGGTPENIKIMPKGDKITLFVANFPLRKANGLKGEANASMPSKPEHSHFELYYALARNKLAARDRSLPESYRGLRIGVVPTERFECEKDVARITKLLRARETPMALPHDPQECVAVQYP